MWKNKRGISPLIATVLIIGFTVALAAVIMTWGQSFSKSMSQSTEQTTNVQLACAQDVQFEVQAVCWDGSALRLTVANNGNKKLSAITARIKESETTIGVNASDMAASPQVLGLGSLPAYGLQVFILDPTQDLNPTVTGSNVKEVELIPVITVGGKDVTCSNAIARWGDVTKDDIVPDC
jgi:flagellin-like protein